MTQFERVPPTGLASPADALMSLKVLVSRNLPSAGQKVLLSRADKLEIVQWREDKPAPRSWMLEHAQGAAGLLVTLSDKVDEELLSAAGDACRVVSTFSAGYDHIDLASLRSRNVRLGYTPDCLTDAVADITVMLALMAQRLGRESIDLVARSQWPSQPWHPLLLCGQNLRNATVGCIGFGRIAQATMARLIPFGIARVIYCTSKLGQPASEDLYGLKSKVQTEPARDHDQLARESHVLFVCCSLNDSTRNLVDSAFLSKMSKTACLVNTSRGPIVSNDALADALDKGQIWGAGLDVIAGEPDISGDDRLARHPRCVLLPHIGSADFDTRHEMARISAENLLAGLGLGSDEQHPTRMLNEKPL
ncbi:uncharacterized protein L969DRAFT_96816 [Mixia osmundae IAM 14324]|uniref:Glyoxylate reductase n=1 Tax=Mixia osmundae (strain CBS 9802 / IAM 14324 / JCM 22182 / KY 12970) TaxID=764103 RepID=G7E263_MIXOS|nr:uncharacterized protein L969DRAFT_96816 [Mixia osmundae IAM 14324]KEI36795.1 hypothetical protein L969DRAFT_96816 [Mixia osmundae IAM 14324]GAA96923.1 hypothetical protein E5Q_03597 [Mixia osmundae IAM 14324]